MSPSSKPPAAPAHNVRDYCVPEQDGLRCACSRDIVSKTGTGSTTRRHFKKKFFYLEQTGEKQFDMWQVNNQHVPAGKKQQVTLDQVMTEFHPEVQYYVQKVAPAMRKLCKHIARGDKHRRNNQPYSAEMEYKGALALDEENVRATFGLGLTYLQFGETEKGREIFENLVGLEGTFDEEYKHLFNEFGIQLRKNGLFPQAAEYYLRALALSPSDENLHFNLARSHFENGQWLPCLVSLCQTLILNPGQAEAMTFCRHLLKKAKDKTGDFALGLGEFSDRVVKGLTLALQTDPEGLHIHLGDLKKGAEALMGKG